MIDRILSSLPGRKGIKDEESVPEGPYRKLSMAKLEELQRENAVKVARGIGNFVRKGMPPVWISPAVDRELVAEFRRRGSTWSGRPLVALSPEEIRTYQAQTVAIMREEEDRFVVIDACRPEELNKALISLIEAGRTVFFTSIHTLPKTIYGTVTIEEPVVA